MDRLSPLDASFLHVEDDVNHMHIGSIGIFEGPPPAYEDARLAVAGLGSHMPSRTLNSVIRNAVSRDE